MSQISEKNDMAVSKVAEEEEENSGSESPVPLQQFPENMQTEQELIVHRRKKKRKKPPTHPGRKVLCTLDFTGAYEG